VATPFDHYLRFPTRRNQQGLVDSLPQPKRVYRRRINRLAHRRLLESIGEEAISNIHILFLHNSPTKTMGDPLRPCNFSNIQGYPHPIPDKATEKLFSFKGNNVVNDKTHIMNFNMCVLKWCNGQNYEDVKMTLFVYSLEGDAIEWFSKHDPNKLNTLA
jgi:hypothetical protein